jgi:magnesium transporter
MQHANNIAFSLTQKATHVNDPAVQSIVRHLSVSDPSLAAESLLQLEPDLRLLVLKGISPVTFDAIRAYLNVDDLKVLTSEIPLRLQQQLEFNRQFPAGSVGRLMDAPVALFTPEQTVSQVIEELRELVRFEFVTYGYVTDRDRRLLGVLVMRDLLFAEMNTKIETLMVKNPFALAPQMPLAEAMKLVVVHHFPVYPVCDDNRKIVGLVRGHRLFESQAFDIIAQAGSMVGLDKEEQVATPITRSFKFRHPWLQLNLLTAFVAGAVVSVFQETIDQVVVLAAFLPVLAGQSGNTGCQALAVTLRAMTLGELKTGSARSAVAKEALLGLANGALVGVSAGIGMYILASHQGNPHALSLAFIVLLAMIGSCVVSGVSGAIVPLVLKRLGADPATASSIFLTTATDVASMGLLLGLATWILL